MSLSRSGRGAGRLSDLGYPVYRRLFDADDGFVDSLDRTLAAARMPIPVELYLSRAITIGLLAGCCMWIAGTALGYGLFALETVEVGTPVGFPVLVLGTGVLFAFVGIVVGFGATVLLPRVRASGREREIDMLLPDAVSFMYALSVGGLNQLETIEAMARADDAYGEVANEFQSIVRETEYFDTDYRTAIHEQSLRTPSDELSGFLTDMLSVLDSGGNMTEFLEEKTDKHMRTAKQQQELTLETLELFGEMYLTLSLFPLLLIIVLVVTSMLGEAATGPMYATVYGLIPLIGAGFLVLVATVKTDEPGDGYLEGGRSSEQRGFVSPGGILSDRDIDNRTPGTGGLLIINTSVRQYIGAATARTTMFDRIRTREAIHRLGSVLRRPHVFFRDYPRYTLGLTVPVALAAVGWAVVTGVAPTSVGAMQQAPVRGTVPYVYVPLYVTLVPIAVFHEWNRRSRRAVVGDLSDALRKLSSANDTGMTLLESIRTVADTTSGTLAREFDAIHANVQYGMSLREALVEFANEYHVPRLARTVTLVGTAQEASSRITRVLTTAARDSENRDALDRERRSRSRMQVAIILLTYLTLLAVMAILKSQFLDVLGGLANQPAGGNSGGAAPGGSLGGAVDTAALNTLFFHAVTIQAIISGTVAGYIRSADVRSGAKFVVALQTVALATWVVVS
ncbi:MAG: type II secretion system F family protein [Halobacteriales archaeon]